MKALIQVVVEAPITVELTGVVALFLGAPATAGVLDFSAEERARSFSHGAWPPAPLADASNRVDGRPDAIELGRRFFFDPAFSSSGGLACASCHQPARAFTDGQATARSHRNRPSLLDAGQRRWFGWDGAHDNLWPASLVPLLAGHEMPQHRALWRSGCNKTAHPAVCIGSTAICSARHWPMRCCLST